jgi:hypothetical protein
MPRFRLTRARAFGFLLIGAGVILLLLAWDAQSGINEIGATNDPLLQDRVSQLESRRDAFLVISIGTLFMGGFAIALLVEPSLPTGISHDEMVSNARMSSQVLAALSLAGNSVYVPAKHGLTSEREFIPATLQPTMPPLAVTDDLVLSPGKDGTAPGILLEPLGLKLLDRVERELGTKLDGTGLEATEGSLQILKHGFGIMKDFHFKERDGKWVLRVEYSGLLDACRNVRKQMPDTCRQMECIGCSCLLTAAARATGQSVSVDEVDNSTDVVVFTLSLMER